MTEELLNDELQETEEVKTYDFPEGTIFYQELREENDVKWLCGTTDNPSLADSLGFLENHMDESELTFVPSNKELTSGVYYIKGHEKPESTIEELKAKKTC